MPDARVGIGYLLSATLVVAACGGGGYGTSPSGSGSGSGASSAALTIVFRNSSASAMHMYSGTDAADASNLVQPGATLNRIFSNPNRDNFDLPVFAMPPAVPNQPRGQGFGTSCRLSGQRNQTQVEVVVDASGLRCVGW